MKKPPKLNKKTRKKTNHLIVDTFLCKGEKSLKPSLENGEENLILIEDRG